MFDYQYDIVRAVADDRLANAEASRLAKRAHSEDREADASANQARAYRTDSHQLADLLPVGR